MENNINIKLKDYEDLKDKIQFLEEENEKLLESFAIRHTASGRIYMSKEEIEITLERHNNTLKENNKAMASVIEKALKKRWFRVRYDYIKKYIEEYI